MIRTLNEADYDAVINIVNENWRTVYSGYVDSSLLSDEGCRKRAFKLKNDFTSHRFEEYIWEENGCAVALLSLGRTADMDKTKAYELWRIYIAQNMQGKGIGSSNARTQSARLKALCDLVGLSDTAVNMLAKLKKNNNARLRIINFLLEQAADEIEDDYEPEGRYEGSVLNAVTSCLGRYSSFDSIVADSMSGSSVIETAIYQIYYEQACAALKNSADEIAADLYNKAVRD